MPKPKMFNPSVDLVFYIQRKQDRPETERKARERQLKKQYELELKKIRMKKNKNSSK